VEKMKRGERQQRGQSSVEYVFILAVIIGFVITVMLPALRESELNIALSAVRNSVQEFASKNSSLYFTSLNYSVSGRIVKITPSVYSFHDNKWFYPCNARKQALEAIRETLSPNSAELSPDANNFTAVNYEYLIECCTEC